MAPNKVESVEISHTPESLLHSVMVQINFWQNSDCFKTKHIFLAQKFTKLEHIKENLSISFKENLSNMKYEFLQRFWSHFVDFVYQMESFWVNLALK